MTLNTISDRIPDTIDTNEMLRHLTIDTPIPMIVALAIYLLTILKIAPSFMKTRKAYQLKTFIVVYNIIQVIACIYLVYKICVTKLPTLQFWVCQDFVIGSAEDWDFHHISYVTFWLKVVELSETVVFVLRKKQRQVSFLHVFHHCATLFLVYQLQATYKSSGALFPLFLNCNVHIVMYVYYLMAAVLPANIVAKLTPFKKSITTIQMIQFALILLQVVVALFADCVLPTEIVCIYVLIITAFFYMFYDFYKKNYSTEGKAANAAAKKKRESKKAEAGER